MSEFLTLRRILTTLNCPIEEEHCLAILYGLFTFKSNQELSGKTNRRSGNITLAATSCQDLQLDDIIVWKNGEVQLRHSGTGAILTDCEKLIYQRKILSSIGVVLWQALDFGLSKDEERSLKASTLSVLETLIDPEQAGVKVKSSEQLIKYLIKLCSSQVENGADEEVHYKQLLQKLFRDASTIRRHSIALQKPLLTTSSVRDLQSLEHSLTSASSWSHLNRSSELHRWHTAVVQELADQQYQLKTMPSEPNLAAKSAKATELDPEPEVELRHSFQGRRNNAIRRRPQLGPLVEGRLTSWHAPADLAASENASDDSEDGTPVPGGRGNEWRRLSCSMRDGEFPVMRVPPGFTQELFHRRLSLRKLPSMSKLDDGPQMKCQSVHDQLMKQILSNPKLIPVGVRRHSQKIPPPKATPHEDLMQSICAFDRSRLKFVEQMKKPRPPSPPPPVELRRRPVPPQNLMQLRPQSLLELRNQPAHPVPNVIRLKVDEISSIRKAVTNFQLDTLIGTQPQEYTKLTKEEICFICLKSFGWFFNSVGSPCMCHICKKKVCKNCGIKACLHPDVNIDVPSDAMSPLVRFPSTRELNSSSSFGGRQQEMSNKRISFNLHDVPSAAPPRPSSIFSSPFSRSSSLSVKNLFRQVLHKEPENKTPSEPESFVCTACASLIPDNYVGVMTT